MPRYVIDRRARIQNHALIRADELRARLADHFLFRKLVRVARGKRKFVRLGHRNARPAMRSAQISRRLQDR